MATRKFVIIYVDCIAFQLYEATLDFETLE